MFNRVILCGRVVAPPETKKTNSGKTVANFNIAVDREKNKDGKREANFFKIVVWGKLAEICQQYLTKGKPIIIEGRLESQNYEKEGQKRTSVFVTATEMRMLPSGNRENKADDSCSPEDPLPF